MTSPQWWVLALTSVASLMAALDTLVVTTALSTIRLGLGASIEQLEWAVNAYNLSFAVLLMAGAAAGDRFGRKRLFILGLGLFLAASAACALSPSIGWLIAGRAIQGAAAALVVPLAMTLLTATFPSEQRAAALGLFSGITGLAVLGGPVVGGAIAEGMAWQWIFWLNLPIGLIVIPLAISRLQEGRGPRAAIDIRGIVLVTAAALGLVWGVVRGNTAGWLSPEVVTALLAGVALASAFVAWEFRAAEPMVPLRFFTSRAFSAGNATGFFLYGSLYGALFFMAQFFQTAQGYGPLGAGLRLLPWTVPLFFIAPLAGTLIGRFGERPLVVGGLLMQSLGMAWIASIASPDLAFAGLIAPLVIAGAGCSMAMPALQHAIMGAVTRTAVGKASGTFNMLRFLGGVLGIAILVAVFDRVGGFGSANAFTDGFAAALYVAATVSLLGAITGLCLPGRKVAEQASTRLLKLPALDTQGWDMQEMEKSA